MAGVSTRFAATLFMMLLGSCRDSDYAQMDSSLPPPLEENETDGNIDNGSESEQVLVNLAPSTDEQIIYVLNRKQSKLTVINASQQSIYTVEVALDPVDLAIAPDGSVWILSWGEHVLQQWTPDEGIIRSIAVRDTVNRMRAHPSGAFLLLDLDTSRLADVEAEQITTLSDQVWLLSNSTTGQAFSSGEPPVDTEFNHSGTPLVAILTPRTLLVLKPTQNGALTTWPLSAARTASELVVSSNGSQAWVRFQGQRDLWNVNLANGTTSAVTMPVDITDLDISADGSKLVVVARDPALSWVRVIDTVSTSSSLYALAAEVGQASPNADGSQALLFTNVGNSTRVHWMNLNNGSAVAWNLPKWINQAYLDGASEHALVIHRDGGTDPVFSFFEDRPTLSVLQITDGRFTPIAMPEEPSKILIGSPELAFLTFTEAKQIATIDLPSQLAKFVDLPSPPLFAGFLSPALGDDLATAWTLLDHPLGQVSFLRSNRSAGDLNCELLTITGFELNAQAQ